MHFGHVRTQNIKCLAHKYAIRDTPIVCPGRSRVAFQRLPRSSYIDSEACSSLPTAVVTLAQERLRPRDSCPAKGEVLPPV